MSDKPDHQTDPSDVSPEIRELKKVATDLRRQANHRSASKRFTADTDQLGEE